jgi:hypothetical protein
LLRCVLKVSLESRVTPKSLIEVTWDNWEPDRL